MNRTKVTFSVCVWGGRIQKNPGRKPNQNKNYEKNLFCHIYMKSNIYNTLQSKEYYPHFTHKETDWKAFSNLCKIIQSEPAFQPRRG